MLIGQLFDSDSVGTLVMITLFTFSATLLTNKDRPYASRYAATSIGSILYGSLDNGVSVKEYIPMRIMLIFVGCCTFLFVELVVFPRSSKTIVQAQSLQFFEDLENFLFDTSKVCGSITSINKKEKGEGDEVHLPEDDPLWMLRGGYQKFTSSLVEVDLHTSRDVVSKTNALARREFRPALTEPSMGLNVSLDGPGYDNLLGEQSKILSQLDLIIITIRSLIGYYSSMKDDHPVRSLHWPSVLSSCLVEMALQLSKCGDSLRNIFPNGLLRPGACELPEVIRGIAMFRNFEDECLSVLGTVSDRHATYLKSINSSDGAVRYTAGFRLTLALLVSAIMQVGQSLSLCGRHLESIVTSFPTTDTVQHTSGRHDRATRQ